MNKPKLTIKICKICYSQMTEEGYKRHILKHKIKEKENLIKMIQEKEGFCVDLAISIHLDYRELTGTNK